MANAESLETCWQSPSKPWDLCSPERQVDLRKAWSAGNLRWKLDPSQQLVYDQIRTSHGMVNASPKRGFLLDVSRQSGKDFIMATIAIETCLRRRCPTRIPYAAPTMDTVKELLVPTFDTIFQDCPEDLLPREIRKGTFRQSSKELTWPWGARIVLVGVDLHPDWLRGPATFAFMFTEPAFVENLGSVMESVLLPQLLTQQEGFYVMGSTPPESPGHIWSTKYIPQAKDRGMYAKRVIEDCPRFSKEQVQAMIEEMGGETATRVRRELRCEHIIESTLAVVPEFHDAKADIVVDFSPPEYRDGYMALDPGFNHATGGLFAYYNFDLDTVDIEGDFAVQRLNSLQVSRYVKAREWQLWGMEPPKPDKWTDKAWEDELAMIKALFYKNLPIAPRIRAWRDGQLKIGPYLRVSDTDSRLIADMSNEHGIVINPTAKDEAETALNAWRVKIQKKRYRIHPRCVNLIGHLEQGIWNKSRTKLAESGDGGHFDCLPAGVYLNRNVIWGKNPNPPNVANPRTHYVPAGGQPQSKTAQALISLFGRRPRR